MRNVIVTGCGGFIGSHLSNLLLKRGINVLGIDNLNRYYDPEMKRARMRALPYLSKMQFRETDICDYSSLVDIFQKFKPETVFHLAAQAGVRLPMDEFPLYLNSNILGFANLSQVSIESGVKDLLYASSSSVYGDTSPQPFSEATKLLIPSSVYGLTKLFNEQYAKIVSANTQTSFRGLRFFTVYGSWGRPDMAYFRLGAALLGESNFALYGSGLVERDFTYIDDVVEITYRLAEEMRSRKEQTCDIVNVGGGRPLSIRQIMEQMELIGRKKINFEVKAEHIGDLKRTIADTSLQRELIGDFAYTPFEDGINSFLDWQALPTIKSQIYRWIQSTL